MRIDKLSLSEPRGLGWSVVGCIGRRPFVLESSNVLRGTLAGEWRRAPSRLRTVLLGEGKPPDLRGGREFGDRAVVSRKRKLTPV